MTTNRAALVAEEFRETMNGILQRFLVKHEPLVQVLVEQGSAPTRMTLTTAALIVHVDAVEGFCFTDTVHEQFYANNITLNVNGHATKKGYDIYVLFPELEEAIAA